MSPVSVDRPWLIDSVDKTAGGGGGVAAAMLMLPAASVLYRRDITYDDGVTISYKELPYSCRVCFVFVTSD